MRFPPKDQAPPQIGPNGPGKVVAYPIEGSPINLPDISLREGVSADYAENILDRQLPEYQEVQPTLLSSCPA